MKKLIVIVLAVAFLLMAAGRTFAWDDGKPGWGYGDINHIHTGPPGQD